MAEGQGYSEAEAREILRRFRDAGGDDRDTNIVSVMAGNLPKNFHEITGTQQTQRSTQQQPQLEQLLSLLGAKSAIPVLEGAPPDPSITSSGMSAIQELLRAGALVPSEGVPVSSRSDLEALQSRNKEQGTSSSPIGDFVHILQRLQAGIGRAGQTSPQLTDLPRSF